MQRAKKDQIFVLLAPGFEESDVTTVTRILRRAGFPVLLVGLQAGPLQGAYGLSLAPDATLSEVDADQPQAVVLPGGMQGARQLDVDPRVHALLRRVVDRGGYVMALDESYMALLGAGLLTGGTKEPTEGLAVGWHNGALASERVMVDRQMVFGRESGAAQESTLTLVSLLENRGATGSRR